MSGAQGLLQLCTALLICKAKLTSTPLQSHLLREGLGKATQGREEGRSLCSWQLRSSSSRGCNVQGLKLLAPLQKELAASCPSSLPAGNHMPKGTAAPVSLDHLHNTKPDHCSAAKTPSCFWEQQAWTRGACHAVCMQQTQLKLATSTGTAWLFPIFCLPELLPVPG